MKTTARIDQMGRQILAPVRALRIVSIVPSQTELLIDLGLSDRVVGITKFCVHPAELRREKTVVGGTKKINLDKVRALKPDLIIGNKEENEQSDIEALEKEFPVWMSDIYTLEDSFCFMEMLGELLDVETEPLIQNIQSEFKKLERVVEKSDPKSVLYLIWNNPVMVAGGNTFIDDILKRLKMKNLSPAERYPVVNLAEQKTSPDLVLLSSEPYPFKEKHIFAFQEQFPNAKVMLVDGEMFSWYGSRLLKAPEYFRTLLDCQAECPD
jgi:ABC-type Fe3+-hydroxamate transport system substrate-binding protein